MRRLVLLAVIIAIVIITVAVFVSGSNSKSENTNELPMPTEGAIEPDQNGQSVSAVKENTIVKEPTEDDDLECSSPSAELETRAVCFAVAYGLLLPDDTEESRRERILAYVAPAFWDNNSVTIGNSIADIKRVESELTISYAVEQGSVYVGSVELNDDGLEGRLEEVTMWGSTIIRNKNGKVIDRTKKQVITTWALRNGEWQVMRSR